MHDTNEIKIIEKEIKFLEAIRSTAKTQADIDLINEEIQYYKQDLKEAKDNKSKSKLLYS